MDFDRYDYGNLRDTAALFGLPCKEKAYELADWNAFYHWRHEILKEEYLYQNREIEGFVIEDSAGYMTKQKLSYYNFWKNMRGVLHEVKKKGYISNTSILTTPAANEFYGWLRRLYDAGELERLPADICTVRTLFYRSNKCCHAPLTAYCKDSIQQTVVSDFQKRMLYFSIVSLNLKKQKIINRHERSFVI